MADPDRLGDRALAHSREGFRTLALGQRMNAELRESSGWGRGRFDTRRGPGKVLFGRMYEDAAIELGAFRPGSKVFCIASAGDTAMTLAPQHQVTAIDVNPVQLAYCEGRITGGPSVLGTAERVLAFGRALAPLVGWRRGRLRDFLDLDAPDEQVVFWRRHLDTARFRAAFDTLMSVSALRVVYAPHLLAFLPHHLGRVLRGRLARGFARHPNRDNPYARALLLGDRPPEPAPPEARSIQLVEADAVSFLEAQPARSFDGFTLSNILDGATPGYRARLVAAIKHAAAPGAMTVLRSFAEPRAETPTNHAERDRSMLWGIVEVRRADALTFPEMRV